MFLPSLIIFRSKSANIKVYEWFKASYSQKLLRELLVCQHQVMMVTHCSAEQLCSITTFIQMHYSDAKVSSHFIKENAKPLPNTSRAQDRRDIRVCCAEPAAKYDERESISSRSIIKLYVMAILVSHLHWN